MDPFTTLKILQGYVRSTLCPVFTLTIKIEVGQILETLKNKKSTGHDGFSNEILKYCSPIIEKKLTEIKRIAIDERKFPNVLKIAKVIAQYTKSDKKIPENY